MDTKVQEKIGELQEKIEEINTKGKRLLAKKKLLEEKRRRQRARLLIEMGGIVSKSKIDLNNNELLGLLSEAKKQLEKNPTIKKTWADVGAKAFEKNQKSDGTPMIITFEKEPSKETKDKIKSLGLRWNRFRREWNGFAHKDEAEKILDGTGAKIETIENYIV